MAAQMNNLGLGIVLDVKDEFSAAMDKAHASFHKVDTKGDALIGTVGKIATGLKLAAIAAAAAGAAWLAYHLAADAAKGETLIAQAARGSAEAIEHLEDAANDVAMANMGVSADEAAQQLRVLSIQANLGAEAATQALVPSLLLAKASLGELSKEAAALGLGQVLREFSQDADQSASVVDKMATVSDVLGTNLKDLQGMMVGAASGANLARASLEDVAIATALVNHALPDAGRATMAVNQAFIQLTGGKAAQNIKKLLGIDVIDQATGKMRPLLEILNSLAAKTSNMGEGKRSALLEQVFGGRGAGGMSVILDQLAEGLTTADGKIVRGAEMAAYLQNRLQGSAGAAKKLADSMDGTFGFQLTKLKTNVETLLDRIGESMHVVFTPLLGLLADVARLGIAMFADFEGGASRAMSGAFGSLVDAFRKVKLAVTALTELFSQGGFSRATYDEMQKAGNEGIMGFAIKVWHWVGVIGSYLEGMVDGFRQQIQTFGPAFEALSGALALLAEALGITSQTAQESAASWDEAGAEGKTSGQILAELAGTLVRVVAGALGVAAVAVDVFRVAWGMVKAVVGPVVGFIVKVVSRIGQIFSGEWAQEWRGMVGIVLDSVGLVLRLVGTLIHGIAGAMDWVAGVFGKDLGLADSVGRELDRAMDEFDRFKEGITGNPVRMPSGPALAIPTPEQGGGFSAIAGLSSMPAPADVPTGPMSTSAGGEEIGRAYQSREPPKDTVVNVNLHLDGEQIASAQVRSKESKAARSSTINAMDEAMRGAW